MITTIDNQEQINNNFDSKYRTVQATNFYQEQEHNNQNNRERPIR